MERFWEILGIMPTSDKKTIRAAYSEQSKKYHPEEEPEAFQKLHEAYEAAIDYAAKYKNVSTQEKAVWKQKAENTESLREYTEDMISEKKPNENKQSVQDKKSSDLFDKNNKNIQEKSEEKENPKHPIAKQNVSEHLIETTDETTVSLLDRLQQKEEEETEKSMQSGALKQFISILEDAKKFRSADVWKAFFLSEDFLKEQFSEVFADGMYQYLLNWQGDGNYQIAQMPRGFLLELAIAYALMTNDSDKKDQIRLTDSFYARKVAASIYNMQREYTPNRVLLKPENFVRMLSFSDYIRLRIMNEKHLLTLDHKESWENMLLGGYSSYLYELQRRNGRDSETRSTCLIDLYVFWLRCETVPKCVLEYMYQRYNLRDIEHTSARKLYAALKQEIIRQYPDIEDALYGREGKEKLIRGWYRELMQIIADNEVLGKEKGKIKTRIEALFERPEWPKIKYSPELFEKMYLQLHNRVFLPVPLAQRLAEFYSDETGVSAGAWDREKGSIMLEGMLHSLYCNRCILCNLAIDAQKSEGIPYGVKMDLNMIQSQIQSNCSNSDTLKSEAKSAVETMDILKICDLELNNAVQNLRLFEKFDLSELSENNINFWHYFFMRGFGCRKVRAAGQRRYRKEYTVGDQVFLPAYIEYIYQPSVRWQKLFTQFDKTKENQPLGNVLHEEHESSKKEKAARTAIEFILPDQKKLKAEFYLHYVLYYQNDELVYKPCYCFYECRELAHSITEPIQFFCLLAITSIQEEEFEEAAQFIETWLSKVPLYPVTIPVIAELLAGDMDWNDEKQEIVYAIYYIEEENYCFRALVKEKSIILQHQTNFGWEYIHTIEINAAESFSVEKKKQQAQKFLQGMKRPKPVRLSFTDLSKMDEKEKAERIIEALKQYEQYRREKTGLEHYIPGYPWREKKEDISDLNSAAVQENSEIFEKESDLAGADAQGNLSVEKESDLAGADTQGNLNCLDENIDALERFFRKDGSFLTESYCVLRLEQEEKGNVFYCSMKPFDFPLSLRNKKWPSTYQFRQEELEKKAKKKHWIVGHFGWGGTKEPSDSEAVPKVFAIGEDGEFFYYDVVRMKRADSLAGLLVKMFDFSKVVSVETYQGYLSISHIDGGLEYCYNKEVFQQSVYEPDITAADLFTTFTKAEMMDEFAMFVDNLLADLPELFPKVVFELVHEKEEVYSMSVCYGSNQTNDKITVKCNGLVWKLWRQKETISEIYHDFKDILYWYMDFGKYGRKLKDCLKIELSIFMIKKKSPVIYPMYKNIEGVRRALCQRTAMTAWNIVINKKKEPEIFDSKFGGVPYWNPLMEYPVDSEGQKLMLLAQINLDQNPMEAPMPKGGMLQFFGCAGEIFAKGFGWREDQDKYRVVYHKTIDYSVSKDELLKLGVPDSTDRKKYGRTPASLENGVDIIQKTAYIAKEDYQFNKELFLAVQERFGKDSVDFLDFEMVDAATDDISHYGHWLLGYSCFVKKDLRETSKNLGEYDRLLFQYDIHALADSAYFEDNGLCGFANFFIRSEDLEKGDFRHVMYEWDGCW